MIIRTANDLGALIRDKRKEGGLDQASLAEKVGVSRQWLSEVEGGKSTAEVGLILRTLNALNVRVITEGRSATRADSADSEIEKIINKARKPD